MEIRDLNDIEINKIEKSLEDYDKDFIGESFSKEIKIGIEKNGEIIAGLYATITSFKILYLSTLFVNEKYRRQGYGKILIKEMEKRAVNLGINTIRLDTFSWQGKEFYLYLNYKIVGFYRNDEDDYEEYFFMKRI